jgi:hypothetical protein
MAYERTWAFSFDNMYTTLSTADQTKRQLWDLKAMLTGQYGGFVSGLWTVYSSCDGAGNFGNGDGVDRWGGAVYTPANIVQAAAGAAHSWFVLRSPANFLGTGVYGYLLIAADSGTTTSASLLFAKTAFAGGTGTANPTSADSWVLGTVTSTWNGATAAPLLHRANMCLDSTGSFYYFTVQGGVGYAALGVACISPVGCHPSDAFPVFTYKYYAAGAGSPFAKDQLVSGGNTQPCRVGVGTAGYIGLVTMGQSMGPTSTPDAYTGKLFTLAPWVMASVSPTGLWHQRGRLPDTYVLPGYSSTPPVQGSVLRDNAGAIAYVLMGTLFIPANAVPNLG